MKLMAEIGVQRRCTGPKHAQRKEENSPKLVEKSMQRSNANLKLSYILCNHSFKEW